MNGKAKTDRASRSLSAFTMIELLVVLAIIGVLAALLLPAISRSRKRAQQIQCIGNLHQFGLGLQKFVADNHAYPSALAGRNSDNPGTWLVQLERGGFDISKPKTNFVLEGVWHCPSDPFIWDRRSHVVLISYGYNAYGSLAIGNRTNALGLLGHFVSASTLYAPIKESEVLVPAEMMAIGDSLGGGVFFARVSLQILDRGGRAFARHQGKANVAFCDGHVESPKLQFLLEDTTDEALVRWNRDHQPHREGLGP